MKEKTFWFSWTANRFARQLRERGVWNVTVMSVQYHPFKWIVRWEEPKSESVGTRINRPMVSTG